MTAVQPEPFTVGVVGGEGLIARYGDVVLYAGTNDEAAAALLGAAETAFAQLAWQQRGVCRPSRERQGNVIARVAVERTGEIGCLAASAENEKLQRCHRTDEVAL